MLTLVETPIHFGVILLLCIIFLVFVLFGILGVLRSESPSASDFSGFLAVVFGFLAFLVLTAAVYLLPAAATATELFPYNMAIYTLFGLHAFCLVFYFIDMSWFKKRMWLVYLPILATLSWMALLWFVTTPTMVYTVSDGFLNYCVMPMSVLAYAGLILIFYLFLVPLWALFRLTKEREGSMKMWTWIGWFGFLLWFIELVLMAFVQFTAPYMLYILSLAAITWILIFLAWYMTTQRR